MSSNGSTSIASFDIDFAGRPLDLMFYVQETARETLEMQLDGVDGAAGTITLVAEAPIGQAPRWLRLVDAEHPEHDQARQNLQDQYKAEGEPTIGIVINRELGQREREEAEHEEQIARAHQALLDDSPRQPPGDGGVVVTVNLGNENSTEDNDRDDDRPAPAEDAALDPEKQDLLDTRQMEDALYKKMIRLGLIMVDPGHVRSNLQQQMERDRRIFREDELVFLIGQTTEMDILLHGVGRIQEDDHVSYTFRAIRMNDGAVLAADGWSSDLPPFGSARIRQTAVEVAASYAVGNLMDQMLAVWEPPRRISVRVSNARSQRDVFMIMNVFEQSLPDVVSVDFDRHETGNEGGLGYFNMRYTSRYEEMIGSITDQEENLGFDLDVEGTTRDTLDIRISDAF